MRVRLNGWQRIGIVLSVLWAIVGGLWGYHIATQEAVATPAAHYKSRISQPYFDDNACSRTMDIRCGVTRSLGLCGNNDGSSPNPNRMAPRLHRGMDDALDQARLPANIKEDRSHD
jgi:hypothetical protein